MSAIENEAWVEAVARAICTEIGGRCVCTDHNAYRRAHCDYPMRSARAAVLALAPLIVERCAEVAIAHCRRRYVETASGEEMANAIRALIQKGGE